MLQIINYLVATLAGLLTNIASIGWLIYAAKTKTEQFKIIYSILISLLAINQFISIIIILTCSKVVHSPIFDVNGIKGDRL